MTGKYILWTFYSNVYYTIAENGYLVLPCFYFIDELLKIYFKVSLFLNGQITVIVSYELEN